ncbi:hypothetical protein AKJ16_DCAP22768 [Drosera capensis]
MDKKTSPPKSIMIMMMMSWALEKRSKSIVDMLETVADDTDMKNKSRQILLYKGREGRFYKGFASQLLKCG